MLALYCISCTSTLHNYRIGQLWPYLINMQITSHSRGKWETEGQNVQQKRPQAGVNREVKSKRSLSVGAFVWVERAQQSSRKLHAGLMQVLCLPVSWVCSVYVCPSYYSVTAVQAVFVYMCEYMQLMIAAHSYFLKHNGKGAVIIFGLEWLIYF